MNEPRRSIRCATPPGVYGEAVRSTTRTQYCHRAAGEHGLESVDINCCNVPRTNILVKTIRREKHASHTRNRAGVPISDVIIKGPHSGEEGGHLGDQ